MESEIQTRYLFFEEGYGKIKFANSEKERNQIILCDYRNHLLYNKFLPGFEEEHYLTAITKNIFIYQGNLIELKQIDGDYVLNTLASNVIKAVVIPQTKDIVYIEKGKSNSLNVLTSTGKIKLFASVSINSRLYATIFPNGKRLISQGSINYLYDSNWKEIKNQNSWPDFISAIARFGNQLAVVYDNGDILELNDDLNLKKIASMGKFPGRLNKILFFDKNKLVYSTIPFNEIVIRYDSGKEEERSSERLLDVTQDGVYLQVDGLVKFLPNNEIGNYF